MVKNLLLYLIVIVCTLLVTLIIFFSKKARKEFWNSVLTGVIFTILIGLLMQFFIIPQLTPSPRIEVECKEIDKHVSIVSFENKGTKEAESLNLIFTNHPQEGSILNFSDSIDFQFCKITNIRAQNKIIIKGDRQEIQIPRRTLISCDFLPRNHKVYLEFKNWAINFEYIGWAKNMETIKGNVSCEWTLSGLDTYYGEN